MKTPCLLALFVTLFFVFDPMPNTAQAQENIATGISQSDALYGRCKALHLELAPARAMMEKCESMRARIHAMTSGPAPRISEADVQYIRRCRTEMARMQQEVESMRSELAASYPVLANPKFRTNHLVFASPNDLLHYMKMQPQSEATPCQVIAQSQVPITWP